MLPFTVQTSISKEEFARIILKRSYKKPVTLILTVIGVLLFLVCMLGILRILPTTEPGKVPVLPMLYGLIAVAMPFIVQYQARKNFEKTPRLHGPVVYHFSEEEISSVGNGFSISYEWKTIVKKEEVDGFVLLFTGQLVAEVIRKAAFTKEELLFVERKIEKRRVRD